MNKGQIFVFSGPSGAGKTSLLRKLLANIDRLKLSTSYTTRPLRNGEKNGCEYHFVDEATFAQMIGADDFLEYARVFDAMYGTAKRTVADIIGGGDSVVLELDWQGAKAVRECFDDVVSVFILPPSKAHLRRRLEERKRDSSEVINSRMSRAMDEMGHHDEFDYVVVNDDFEKTHGALETIVRDGAQDDASVAHSREVIRSLGLGGAR